MRRVDTADNPLPGFRRRLLIEPAPGEVTAELEDDYHRMLVTLRFADGIVTGIEGKMKRSPWTTCPGAIAQLQASFVGRALDAAITRDERIRHCTHLLDLAIFAAAHAGEARPLVYEVEVADPIDGVRRAQMWRNGARLYEWKYTDKQFLAPSSMAGMPAGGIGRWIEAEPAERQEAARILRWAAMIAMGRQLDIEDGSAATRFATGACFSLQPAMAAIARRRPGAAIDFRDTGTLPLADRSDRFARGAQEARP
jgi:hypothetical protein